MAPKADSKSMLKILIATPLVLGGVGGLVWYGTRGMHGPLGGKTAGLGGHSAEHEPEGDGHGDMADHEDSTGEEELGAFSEMTQAIPVAALLEMKPDGGAQRPDCATAEIQGPGPEMHAVSAADWAQVMDVYHDAKARLIGWLERQRSSLTPALFAHMKREIEMLRVQRPPSEREPDLAWRGIAVMTDDGSKAPLVRLGGGMIELVKTDRARATFELARVLAERWAPCALSQQGGGALWKSLEGCLQSEEDPKLSCIPGGYSESGWMISTAVAARVADPGCRISGLVPEPGRKECRDRGAARAPASHASKKAHAEPEHHGAEKKHDDSHSTEKAHAEPEHHSTEKAHAEPEHHGAGKKHDDSHSTEKAHAEPEHHGAEKKHDDSHSTEKAHAEPEHHGAEKKHDDSHGGHHSGSEGGH